MPNSRLRFVVLAASEIVLGTTSANAAPGGRQQVDRGRQQVDMRRRLSAALTEFARDTGTELQRAPLAWKSGLGSSILVGGGLS
jgi:hypothetical protein